MSVTSSSLQLAGNEVHIDLQLNEAPNPGSIDTSDLIVSAGTVSSVQLLAADRVRFTLTGISAETALNISLPAGAFLDNFGNPSLASSSILQIDFATTSLPTPLPQVDPLGSLLLFLFLHFLFRKGKFREAFFFGDGFRKIFRPVSFSRSSRDFGKMLCG